MTALIEAYSWINYLCINSFIFLFTSNTHSKWAMQPFVMQQSSWVFGQKDVQRCSILGHSWCGHCASAQPICYSDTKHLWCCSASRQHCESMLTAIDGGRENVSESQMCLQCVGRQCTASLSLSAFNQKPLPTDSFTDWVSEKGVAKLACGRGLLFTW